MRLDSKKHFPAILSMELAHISDHKTMYSSKACTIILMNALCLMSYGVNESDQNEALSYLESFLSVLTNPPKALQIPVCVLLLILNLGLIISVLFLSFHSYKAQDKVNVSNKKQQKMRIYISQILEIMIFLSCPILSVNMRLIREPIGIPVINLILYTVMFITHLYFYRSYKFNQRGFYRTFDFIQYFYYFSQFSLILIDEVLSPDISPFFLLILSLIQILEILLILPYRVGVENAAYTFGLSANLLYSTLGVLNQLFNSIGGNNLFESFFLFFPLVYAVAQQLIAIKWREQITYVKSNHESKQLNVQRLCLQLECLVWYVEQARTSNEKLLLVIQILKHHISYCSDTNCECRFPKELNPSINESMTHRSSFHSKTALLSNQDKASGGQQQSQNFEYSQQMNKTVREFSQQKPVQQGVRESFNDFMMIELAKKVGLLHLPMRFLKGDSIDEELIAKYVKRQFHQTIQMLSFTINLDQVEYLSLKYISFMFSFKQNSPSSLVKLRQIQSRSANFSFFFNKICNVSEDFLVEAIKFKHKVEIDQNSDEFLRMNVVEIWRLEIVKEIIVRSIVAVLRKKIRVWEELCSGEISNMDKLLASILVVSTQIEDSKSLVHRLLSDFPHQVQKNYSYYLKYQCFSSLFFDSDYKKAVSYQRKVEDAWQLSKASQRLGQLGNYSWLCGDMITLEVSIAVNNGFIVKGLSQRLADQLGYSTYEDMIAGLKLRSTASSSHSNQSITVQSLMPPFLMASHNYYVNRFLQRGYTSYYGNAISSFASDAQGYIFPVYVHLSFNFQNNQDFTLLGSILKIKDEQDYLIFDEWGRILGVSVRMFEKLIQKGALEEFGLVQFQEQKLKKYDKQSNLKNHLINKIAQDDNAKFFKKTLTMHQQSMTSRTQVKRTYHKPSDILLQFGSVQHFLPQIGIQMSELLAKDIFKKLQKESQQQFNKLTELENKQNDRNFEKQASNIFQRQISAMLEKQQSMREGGLSSGMLDKNHYRNFLRNMFLEPDGTMKKSQSILQDEKLTLFVPRNYNELIEYFNDAGDRYMESKGDFETRSIKRQQIQNKHTYVKQQQNCYHIFDADFQAFIDNKVRKYYSKSLLKEAIESHDSKFLNMVRYKTIVSVDLGLGGVNDDDQFLYFICKLSNLNMMTAKRRDVLKLHLKKDRKQQFDGGEELRKSLLNLYSQDSIDNPRLSKQLIQSESLNVIEKKQKPSTAPPVTISLAIPDKRSYNLSPERDEGPNLKADFQATFQKLNDSSFEIEGSMKDSLISNNMRQSLNVPQFSRQGSLEIKAKQANKQEPQTVKPKVENRQSFGDIIKSQSSSSNQKYGSFSSDPKLDDLKFDEPDAPKKKLKLSFLSKMEKALQSKNEQAALAESPQFKQPSLQISVPSSEKRGSLLSPGQSSSNNIFAKLFQRLNLRRVSNVEIKNDIFEQQQDQGFKEQSENSDSNKDKSQSLSQSNSMSSNNMSIEGLLREDDDLKNQQEDELVNIFEVMSQASNHQSIKSISAISMATNISLRCLSYMPKQASSLQLFKLILILLNIAGIISLLLTTQRYFENLSSDPISNDISNRYRYLLATLQSSNQIDQLQIINFSYVINENIFARVIEESCNRSSSISQSYYYLIERLNVIKFPLSTPQLLLVPTQYQTKTLSDFLTNDKIELDSMKFIYDYRINKSSDVQLYNVSMDLLINRFLFTQAQLEDMSSQLIKQNNDLVYDKALVIMIVMGAFGGLHIIVIFFIVPFIKQINDIYWRVLQIVSRITQEEAVDEIKKLTLCQHLLESNDDSWVTSNQIKLVFYNRGKGLEINQKQLKGQKGKESSYFQTKLSDSSLSIWRDMILYLSISGISIAYFLFSIITIQSQLNQFKPYIENYDSTVKASVLASTLLTKLSISPQRYLNIHSNGHIPSQVTLFHLQKSGHIPYLLQSIDLDAQEIRTFMNDLTNFQEKINLENNYVGSESKTKVTKEELSQRMEMLQKLSLIQEINHLLKDNLCFYSQENLCEENLQFDYFNTGLIGALDLLAKFSFNYQQFLKEYHTISFSNERSPEADLVQAYYNSQDFHFLVANGQRVIGKTFERLTMLMKEFLRIEKNDTLKLVSNLYLGIGIPIMALTLILAVLEMMKLRRKVKRVMLSLTYLPTFKYQEKIVLSLIKSVLRI